MFISFYSSTFAGYEQFIAFATNCSSLLFPWAARSEVTRAIDPLKWI